MNNKFLNSITNIYRADGVSYHTLPNCYETGIFSLHMYLCHYTASVTMTGYNAREQYQFSIQNKPGNTSEVG
jgi:hypothetical protein